jgi:hypothetical protein
MASSSGDGHTAEASEASAATVDTTRTHTGEVDEEGVDDPAGVPLPTGSIATEDMLGKRQATSNDVASHVGEWFLRDNAHDGNLLGDVARVDYCGEAAGDPEKRGRELRDISLPFSDNIMAWALVPETWCEKKRSGLFLLREQTQQINAAVRGAFRHVRVHEQHGTGVKIKLPVLLDAGTAAGVSSVRSSVGDIMRQRPDIAANYRARFGAVAGLDGAAVRRVIVPIKVDLADVPLDVLLEAFPKILRDLQAHTIYLLDFDITIDTAGIFRKADLVAHARARNFHVEGDGSSGLPRLLNNSRSAGDDCLTYMDEGEGSALRKKFYNKFVCQITSPAVTRGIGNHLFNFLHSEIMA